VILASGGIGDFAAERLLGSFLSQKNFYSASRELSNGIHLNDKITKIGRVIQLKCQLQLDPAPFFNLIKTQIKGILNLIRCSV
jgi:hypothetical protein